MALRPQTFTKGNLVDKHINTAYDTVRLVALNISDVIIAAGAVATTAIVADHVTEIDTAAAAIAEIILTGNDITSVITTANNIADVNTVAADIAAGNITAAIAAAISTAADLAGMQEIFDDFSAQYLGPYATDPTLDNEGQPLQPGAVYWNTTDSEMRFYNGASWEAPTDSAITSAINALASETAAAISEANALSSAQAAAASEIVTADDAAIAASAVAATNADAASTASDVIATGNDRIATNADVVTTNGDAISTGEDVVSSAANALESENWGNYPENSLVPEGNQVDEFSAFHWMKKTQAFSSGALTYQGNWDASGGVFPSSPSLGNFYKITVAGTIAPYDLAIGDSIIFNGTDWDKIDNSEQVTSVGGYLGAVTAAQLKITVESNSNTNALTDALLTKLNAIESTATQDQTATEIQSLYESHADINRFTDALLSKLNSIESSATADQTAAQILALLLTVDGSGSGLDADKLDGVSSGSFARLASPAFSGTPTAPTQSTGTNNTRLATTAYVKNQGYITTATPGANSVGQSALKSTTASQSDGTPSYNYHEISLTGGSHTMFWAAADGNSNQTGHGGLTMSSGTYGTKITGQNPGGKKFNTFYVYSRYVQASPPYNLGDGDIPLFIYLLIDNTTGLVEGSSTAVDPHWAYNGGILLTPDRIDGITGKKFKNVPQFVAESFDIMAGIRSGDPVLRNQAMDMLVNKELAEVEIDHDYQNQAKNTAPHPWHDRDLTGKTVVLLDPSCDMMTELYELNKQFNHIQTSDDSILNLLTDDYIRYDNSPLNRTMPNGVVALAPRWKNTV